MQEQVAAREVRRKERLQRHLAQKSALAERIQLDRWEPDQPSQASSTPVRSKSFSPSPCAETEEAPRAMLPPVAAQRPLQARHGSAASERRPPLDPRQAKQLDQLHAVAAQYGKAFQVAARQRRKKGAGRSASLPSIAKRPGGEAGAQAREVAL